MTEIQSRVLTDYIRVNAERSRLHFKLKELYERNPKTCEACGKKIQWNSHGEVDQSTGLALTICICKL